MGDLGELVGALRRRRYSYDEHSDPSAEAIQHYGSAVFLVTPSYLISAGTELSRRWKKSTPSTPRTEPVQVKVESDANPIGLET